MEYVFGYALLFLIGSVAGWCMELIGRRLFTAKKWINPGFLTGPYLPIYGFGVCILYAVSELALDWWWKLLIIGALMTAIEYIGGIIFIKGMGIKLWDYSREWGNLQGVICPKYTLLWTALGAVFLFLLHRPLSVVFVWAGAHPNFSFAMGLLYGVMLVDLGLSLHLSTKIRAIAKRAKEVVSYERLKLYIAAHEREHQSKRSFLFPFRSAVSLKVNLENFLAAVRAKREERHKSGTPQPPKDGSADDGKGGETQKK